MRHIETRLTREDGTTWIEGRATGPVKLDTRGGEGFVVDCSDDSTPCCVCDFVYLGSKDAAANGDGLSRLGIKRILNVGTGIPCFFAHDPAFCYLAVKVLDTPDFNILELLPHCLEFLRESVANGKPVLVHCSAGVSRSASVVVAYLISKGATFDQALKEVRKARPCAKPNVGFAVQLRQFEMQLYPSRATEGTQ